MSKQSKRFSTYSLSLTGMEKADKEIGPFCEDREKNVWVGTRNGLWFSIHKLILFMSIF